MNWIRVNDKDETTLPPLDKVVAIIWLSSYDDNQVFSLGGRVDDGEGWLWAVNASDSYTKGSVDDLETDDDHRVTHWAEIEWPEEG